METVIWAGSYCKISGIALVLDQCSLVVSTPTYTYPEKTVEPSILGTLRS